MLCLPDSLRTYKDKFSPMREVDGPFLMADDFHIEGRWVRNAKPPSPELDCPADTLRDKLSTFVAGRQFKPGAKVAIAVGSRGIDRIAALTKELVQHLQSLDTRPFIVPAMGSHGGGTAEGQTQVLASFGITETSMGCPIRAGMQVERIPHPTWPVHVDTHAFQADHLLVMNRIKPHTRFAGRYQSGICKMLTIGLGNHVGAAEYHRRVSPADFDAMITEVCPAILKNLNLCAGIGLIENQHGRLAEIHVLPPDSILEMEPKLLARASELCPKLALPVADLLAIDEIGKEISGTGMDTNVIGRKGARKGAQEGDCASMGSLAVGPNYESIYVRGLTEATQGNGVGIGLAELCHQQVFEQIDWHKSCRNAITARHLHAVRSPVRCESDRHAVHLGFCVSSASQQEAFRLVRIQNTSRLDRLWCSSAFSDQAIEDAGLIPDSEMQRLQFDRLGNFADDF